jgi:tRNA(fMet)-specific endonuclease VapC
MIFLDTDHVTILRYADNPRCARLAERMRTSGEEFCIPVICVEEQMRGWLAEINRHRNLHDQVIAYEQLAGLFRFFARWEIVSIDAAAADLFEDLRRRRIRIGTMDLKIAAIAVSQSALLLSANLSDFRQVPGLRVENWLV